MLAPLNLFLWLDQAEYLLVGVGGEGAIEYVLLLLQLMLLVLGLLVFEDLGLVVRVYAPMLVSEPEVLFEDLRALVETSRQDIFILIEVRLVELLDDFPVLCFYLLLLFRFYLFLVGSAETTSADGRPGLLGLASFGQDEIG